MVIVEDEERERIHGVVRSRRLNSMPRYLTFIEIHWLYLEQNTVDAERSLSKISFL